MAAAPSFSRRGAIIAARSPETVQWMKRLFLFLLACGASAAVLSGSAVARGSLPPANGIEPIGSNEWPSVPAQLAKNIAKASFAHQYNRVWSYLHPTYQRAVSRSHWIRCQGSHPAAPPKVTITKVSVASATELPVDLPLLGRQNVQEIQLQVRYTTKAADGQQFALLYAFWLKQAKTWRAVWLSDEYAAYKVGGCYLTPQGPPLY